MLNGLLHQAAPGSAPSAMKALDKKTVERMVLSSLRQPLVTQLRAMIPAVTDAFRTQRALVKTRMATAARSGVVDAAVRTALEQNLTASSEPGLGTSVPRVVAFQTTANFSNVTAAGEGVEAGFSAAAMTTQIASAYEAALGAAQRAHREPGRRRRHLHQRARLGAGDDRRRRSAAGRRDRRRPRAPSGRVVVRARSSASR